MSTSETRKYNCKDEELPVICRYILSRLKRDLEDFKVFSPLLNEEYVGNFDGKISLVDELISPKIETDELKKITQRLYKNMDALLEPVAKIRGYIRLAKDTVGVSAKDFGLTSLTQKISSRDSEGVRQNLLIVNSYIKKYQEPLMAVGLNNEIIEQLITTVTLITNDNQLQFDILSQRKAIVQKNMKVLNELYEQLSDLLNIGRALYKNSDPVKAKEYTFSSLIKSVRTVKK
jgi:hypothetical protein